MIGTWRTKISDNLYYPYTYSSDVSLPGYHRGAPLYVQVRPVPQLLTPEIETFLATYLYF